jgi:glyceraldehyde 3-phosphate dehydrogenase
LAVKVGIIGFGRIGRQSFGAMLQRYPDDIEVVAVNDLTDDDALAHLLKYDSNYGKFDGCVEAGDGKISVNGKSMLSLEERDPAKLPWSDLGVEIVVESTGFFRDDESAGKHLEAGAKKVVISAPAKGDVHTVVLGVNEDTYCPDTHHIVSNASCTTNCLAPVAKVLHDNYTITQGWMTTIHAYTSDQNIVDGPHKDLRRARTAALNMVPTSTGAAAAIGLVIPELKGKLDGIAIRVPTATVSVVDLVCSVAKPTTTEDVLAAMKAAATEGPLAPYFEVCEEPLVSIDFKGNPNSSILDAENTQVMDGTLVKALSWYDNEWGYSCRTADLVKLMADKGL